MKAQTKWSWPIAMYLFLAGLGGGAYVAGVLADFAGLTTGISKIGVLLGFPCVFAGCMFLVADLGLAHHGPGEGAYLPGYPHQG